MLKKVVAKKLGVAAHTVRHLSARELGQVNGGQCAPGLESGQSMTIEVCSSKTQ